MKKTLAIIVFLMISISVSAQSDWFFKSNTNDIIYDRSNLDIPNVGGTPSLPTFGGGDQNAEAPLGTGIFLLTVLGAGYAISKRRKEER